MTTVAGRGVAFASGDITLEGQMRDGTGAGAAVVLHPHPQYGGDMHNHVVAAACATLAGLGFTTLRFNFRGAGRSEGAYDGGRGEADDARAAIAFVREQQPEGPLLLCGYSFGAMVAAAVAIVAPPDALVLVSSPLQYGVLPVPDDVPALVIAGDRDPIVPTDALARLERPNVRVVIIHGADHSWWPGVEDLQRELQQFADATFVNDEGRR